MLICAGCVSFAAPQLAAPVPPPKSTVCFIQNDSAIADFKENPAVVRRMVDSVVMAATEKNDVAGAWRSLVKPGDRVGIKISTVGGRLFSTHKSVVEAVVEGLESAGISRKDIIIWDRDGLAAAGYPSGFAGCQVRSIEGAQGYDPQAVISSGVLGKLIWGDLDFLKRDSARHGIVQPDRDPLSPDSHLCKIVSQAVTKIINVPVLSTSEARGVAGSLYNVTVPNVDNWRRFAESDSFLCDIYADERLGPKVVLNLMDGLLAQFAGGPEFQPNYTLPHGTIYASKDPVALDCIALGKIEEWRAQSRLPPIAPRAVYLKTAAEMGIGAASPERIDLKMVRPQ